MIQAINLIPLVRLHFALQIVPVLCRFAYLKFIALTKIILKAENNDHLQTRANIKHSGKVSPIDQQRIARFVYIKCSVGLKNGGRLSGCLVTLMLYGKRSKKEEEVQDIIL